MSSSTQDTRIALPLLALFFVAGVFAPQAVSAQSCLWSSDLTPASPAPSALWNGLQPTETVIPSCQTGGCESRDTSWFNTNGGFGLHNPYFESLDIEQGKLFTAINLGVQRWNLNNPAIPDREVHVSIHALAPVLHSQPHDYFIVKDLDAPDNNPNLLAVTGRTSMGLVIASSIPAALYQDHGAGSGAKDGTEVYATRIGGRDYAFMAAIGSPSDAGLWVYDMTAAQGLSQVPCVESRPLTVNPACNGVYQNRLSTEKLGHVDGAGNFVVFSGGAASLTYKGFEIWNVSNPSSAFQVHSGLTNDRIDGVALWQQSGRYYLALHNRTARRGEIYDVSCIANNSCGGLSLEYSFPLVGFTSFGTIGTVMDSTSNGTPYVYFGGKLSNNMSGLQEEWLFNTAPLDDNQDPEEITGGDPQNGNQGQPTINVGGDTVGYWSYYYMCNESGTNFARPNGGKFSGNHFYRAGHSILDVHRRQNLNPTITVTGPSTGFTGQNLVFNASAVNCSPAANGWTWTAPGGTFVGSATGSSVTINWPTPGSKTVTAENSACGNAEGSAVVNITSAAPAVGSVSRSPASAPVCTPITFTAINVTGQPPLTYGWEVLDGGSPTSAPACPGTSPGETFCWDTTTANPGTYQGRVTVSGPGGPDAVATSPTVTLTALPALPGAGEFSVTNDPFTAGTVQFHSSVAGATEWRWNFGDGTIFETTDPIEGPDPVHTYGAIGTYQVTLEVRNCQNPTYVISAPHEVTITQITPLEIVTWQASCPFGQCSFNVGGAINFTTVVTGSPDTYEYDWEGTGSFISSPTPINSHSYSTAGTRSPVLRLRRGAETVQRVHSPPLVISSGTPPPTATISVNGPSPLQVNQSGTYTASASNCTPSPSGWSWTTSGGTGSSSTSSISVSWSTPGVKAVRATNSACGSASGQRIVTVNGTTPPPGGGDLVALFSITPNNPTAGEEITFNAGASQGNPTSWSWDFGDGSNATGEVVQHAYSQPGNYSAQLTISKNEPGCGSFGQNVCTDTITQTIVVSGDGTVCVQDGETLCLFDNRFEVTARWRDQRTGDSGNAKVYTPFSSRQTGMFWFFRPDNVELIVKSLDGRTINGSWWFFYGGLSDVEYWITVKDTETDEINEYHNEPGSICGFPDTEAFPEAEGGGAQAQSSPLAGWTSDLFESQSAPASGTCVATGNNLCLLDGRFSLEVDWRDHRSGDTGLGTPVVGTDRTGYFWFFNAQNIELVAKMIDASDPFGYFWVLWGGLSDVEYNLRVTDTVTGQQQVYTNPPGSFCGGGDTTAFESE